MKPTIRDHMTPVRHSASTTDSLATALVRMTQNGVRHLPVFDGEQLAGMVSERDILFLRSFRDVDPDRVLVEEAMAAVPYVVGPADRLSTVASHMARHHIGSAIVIDKGRVVGIFTTNDALRVLASAMRSDARKALGPPDAGKSSGNRKTA